MKIGSHQRRKFAKPEYSDNQTVREVGRLLARGMRRLRQFHAVDNSPCSKMSAKLAPACLELSPETVLSVNTRVNGPESPRRRKNRSAA